MKYECKLECYTPYVQGVVGCYVKLTFKQKIKILFSKKLNIVFIHRDWSDEL